jgi:hypothetical protein
LNFNQILTPFKISCNFVQQLIKKRKSSIAFIEVLFLMQCKDIVFKIQLLFIDSFVYKTNIDGRKEQNLQRLTKNLTAFGRKVLLTVNYKV